jgi:hypothetical protein
VKIAVFAIQNCLSKGLGLQCGVLWILTSAHSPSHLPGSLSSMSPLFLPRFSVSVSLLSLKVVTLLQNLPNKELMGKSDPYAKVYLIGDGLHFAPEDKHLKTKTHKNNLNPEFNETFKFKVGWGGGGASSDRTQCKLGSCR